MSASILNTVKKNIGIDESYMHFDADILMHINTILTVLTQIGIGPADGFEVSSEAETWSDFLGENHTKLNTVKTYVSMRVRLLFDPPSSGAVIEVYNNTIKEMEYRLYITKNPEETFK